MINTIFTYGQKTIGRNDEAISYKRNKTLPCASKNVAAYEIAKQLIRSAGSVAANYRASKRAKSTADFINKIEIVLEEADESHYWLTIIKDAEILNTHL